MLSNRTAHLVRILVQYCLRLELHDVHGRRNWVFLCYDLALITVFISSLFLLLLSLDVFALPERSLQ